MFFPKLKMLYIIYGAKRGFLISHTTAHFTGQFRGQLKIRNCRNQTPNNEIILLKERFQL